LVPTMSPSDIGKSLKSLKFNTMLWYEDLTAVSPLKGAVGPLSPVHVQVRGRRGSYDIEIHDNRY